MYRLTLISHECIAHETSLVTFWRASGGDPFVWLSPCLGLVRLALNPCGLSGIGWVWIPNKSIFFLIFFNLIQSICIGNNRTRPYRVWRSNRKNPNIVCLMHPEYLWFDCVDTCTHLQWSGDPIHMVQYIWSHRLSMWRHHTISIRLITMEVLWDVSCIN
jgi:hypothetical protein